MPISHNLCGCQNRLKQKKNLAHITPVYVLMIIYLTIINIKRLKVDRPHPCDYLHTPTNYINTDKHLSSNGLAVRVLMERQTSTHMRRIILPLPLAWKVRKKYQTHFPLCIVLLEHHFPHWLGTNIDSPSRQTLLLDTSYLDIQLKLGNKNVSVCNTLHQKRNSLVV